ncbi:Uncharacterised protein [Salmonella enterica subsp. enterica serovar Typhi]|nr:Uncharacterised protein [Salmonella enterica subsp. enterica serovar Typhi]
MADQRFGVDTAKLLFAHREGHHRHIGRFDTLVRQLFIERHVGVAVDGGDHSSFAAGGEFLYIGHNSLVIAVTKRGIDLFNIFILYAFGVQEGAQNFVGGARIDIVRAEQEEAFSAAAVFTHHVFHRRDRLLVWCRAGVEYVR